VDLAEVTADGIRLCCTNLSKQQVEDLPPVAIDHPRWSSSRRPMQP
jgi:hypothetical protein